LSLRHSRPAAASCLPPSLLCQLPQQAPPPFAALLHPLVQLIVVLPGGLPPPLSQRLCLCSRLPICWLSRRVASGCLVHWPSPPPFIMPPPLVAPLLFGWWLRCVAWRPGLSLCPARWPLIMQPPLVAPSCPPADATFLLTPPPIDVPLGIVKGFKLACQWGDSMKTHAIWMYYCAQMTAATKKTTIGYRHCTYN
jgi:hypothetical protein